MDAALADEIEHSLRELGDPARALQERRYLKSSLQHYGVTVPLLRREVASWVALYKRQLDRDLVVGVCQELWSRTVHETRAFAVYLLDKCSKLLVPDDLVLVERMVREAKTWAFVDDLATSTVPPLLERCPDRGAILDRWAADEDFWIRRTALLALLPGLKKSDAEWPRFTRYAVQMLDEKEFFIRKAIGWILRDVSRRRPEPVRAFVAEHGARMSGVTRREATKYLG